MLPFEVALLVALLQDPWYCSIFLLKFALNKLKDQFQLLKLSVRRDFYLVLNTFFTMNQHCMQNKIEKNLVVKVQ